MAALVQKSPMGSVTAACGSPSCPAKLNAAQRGHTRIVTGALEVESECYWTLCREISPP